MLLPLKMMLPLLLLLPLMMTMTTFLTMKMRIQRILVSDSHDDENNREDHEEMEERRRMLASAMRVLNERERKILAARRLQDVAVTLEDLSRQYGISRERVRQIEVRAFEKLKETIRDAALAKGMTEPLCV